MFNLCIITIEKQLLVVNIQYLLFTCQIGNVVGNFPWLQF